MRLYSVYDRVAHEFFQVAEFKNDAAASRMFNNMLANNLPPGSKPEDYDLFCLGSFDRDIGRVIFFGIDGKETEGQAFLVDNLYSAHKSIEESKE